MLGLVMLLALVEMLGVLSIMPFLSVLGRPEIVHEHRWLQEAYVRLGLESVSQFIIVLGAASAVLVVACSAFKTFAHHAMNRFVHFKRFSISQRLLQTYLAQPYEFFLERNSSELSKNVLSETDQLVMNLLNPLMQMVAQGAILGGMLLLVFTYDPLMAIAILGSIAALYAAIYVLVNQRLRRIGSEAVQANKARFKSCAEAFGGVREVKTMHAESAHVDSFSRAARTHARHVSTGETLSQTPLHLVEALGYCGLIGIALALLARNDDIGLVLPALGLYGFAAYRMLPAAQIIYRAIAKLRFTSAVVDTIHRDLMLPAEISTHHAGEALIPAKHIRLDGVYFAYPSAPHKTVLKGLSLNIEANTTTGIIGRSGAGKSTLMDIILGLLTPQKGHVLIDDCPLNVTNRSAWQRSIGYVPQHVYLLDATLAENIAFGVPREEIDMDAVELAARAAQLEDFVTAALPDGYNTVLGDRGARLSGGQRQRTAIARALYRNPAVLLFDEATSALDQHTRGLVYETLNSLRGSRTIIVITHDEYFAEFADTVISLK